MPRNEGDLPTIYRVILYRTDLNLQHPHEGQQRRLTSVAVLHFPAPHWVHKEFVEV